MNIERFGKGDMTAFILWSIKYIEYNYKVGDEVKTFKFVRCALDVVNNTFDANCFIDVVNKLSMTERTIAVKRLNHIIEMRENPFWFTEEGALKNG